MLSPLRVEVCSIFYLPLALLTLALAPWIIDRRRLAALFGYGLLASVLATLHDRFVLWYHLWEYRDSGPFSTHEEIAVLISLTAAPVMAMRFAQGLPNGRGVPWMRIAKFTGVAMLPEVVGLYVDRILYHQWWNVGFSVLAYLPIWLSLWGFHRWMGRSANKERKMVRTL